MNMQAGTETGALGGEYGMPFAGLKVLSNVDIQQPWPVVRRTECCRVMLEQCFRAHASRDNSMQEPTGLQRVRDNACSRLQYIRNGKYQHVQDADCRLFHRLHWLAYYSPWESMVARVGSRITVRRASNILLNEWT